MDFLTTILAQAAQPSGGAGAGLLGFLPMILILAIFYFLLIVPQRRMQKKHAAMVAALQKGDRVITSGGLIGEIMAVRDTDVTVKTGSSTVVVERGSIRRVMGPEGAAA